MTEDTSFDFKQASNRIKYASSASNIDTKKKKIEVMMAEEPCFPVKINCKGSPSAPDLDSSPKNLTRHKAPTIKTIAKCSDSPSDLSNWIKGDAGSI
jgi:hypothetical protein